MLLASLLTLAALPTLTFQDGVLTPPLIGSPAEAAERFAASRRAELGVDARSTLEAGRLLSTRFGGTVQLEQKVSGLPVYGARVVVTFDEAQRVVRVSSSLRPFGVVNTAFRLDARQALERATHEVDGAWLRSDGVPYGGATRRAFVVNGELHAGWLTFVPTLKHSESWHVAIDATDGTVLFVENRARASNAARVYASSPGGVQAGVGVTPTVDVTLGHLADDAGFLRGTQIRALNCCPTANCDPDAGPARATGQTQTFQGPVDFDVAVCDQRPRATNDPAVHPSGDYVYAPVDPPNTAAPSIRNPADFDEFAEVHAYFHVNKAYDAVRALSVGPLARDGGFSPFRMRDTGAGGDLPAVWVNVADADFANATPNSQGVYVSNTLSRVDNAMYLPRENMEFLLLPPQVLASDALVIYQGEKADFAYDGPVLWHEFGHGVIHSTADWTTGVTFDAWSANNESSALDEGNADLLAAMTGRDPVVGAYVGPRIDPSMSAIRDVSNQERCPDVLWGESHQDSLHYTGAVWAARQLFLGTDDGATFDAAFYAALVSFPPDVNFERAAAIIASAVAQAFPQDAMAKAKVEAVFRERGVVGCFKVLDVTDTLDAPRTYFGIPGTTFAQVADGLAVPGPYQFKIRAPRGIKSVSFKGLMQAFGTSSRLDLMASAGSPIVFTKTGTSLTNDAQAHATPTLGSMGNVSGTVNVAVECGGEVYVALGNTSRRDRALYELEFSVVPADSCPEPMPVDAGTPPPPEPTNLGLAPESLGAPAQGCGCAVVDPLAVLGVVVVLLRRRTR
ncbi:MAG: hypothetical protein ACOZQL_23140 [Myxococcota bacterium]